MSSTGSKTGPALPQGCWPYSPRPSSKESRWSRIGLCEAAPGGSTLGAYQKPPLWIDKLTTNGRKPFALSLSKGGRKTRLTEGGLPCT